VPNAGWTVFVLGVFLAGYVTGRASTRHPDQDHTVLLASLPPNGEAVQPEVLPFEFTTADDDGLDHSKYLHKATASVGVILKPDHPMPDEPIFYVVIGGVLFLLILAAIMAGLTVGISSLDELKLRMVMESGTEQEKREAKRLRPLVTGNREQLLVTIIIVNSICLEWVPTLLQRFFSETFTLIVSVTLVLIFGEIMPQVLCLKRPIHCGANFVWLIYILKIATWPIAKPMTMFLDCLLGHRETKVLFTGSELTAVIDLLMSDPQLLDDRSHVLSCDGEDQLKKPLLDKNDPGNQSLITQQTTKLSSSLHPDSLLIMKGALMAMDSAVAQIARPMSHVFMMQEDEVADQQNVERILDSGHSRVPIHARDSAYVIRGILLVKRLALEYQVSESPKKFSELIHAQPLYFDPELNILAALNQFQQGKSHMAFIQTPKRLIGMITLEDVMEFMIQEPIGDETDRLLFSSKVLMSSVRTIASTHNVLLEKWKDQPSMSPPNGPLDKPRFPAGARGSLPREYALQLPRSSSDILLDSPQKADGRKPPKRKSPKRGVQESGPVAMDRTRSERALLVTNGYTTRQAAKRKREKRTSRVNPVDPRTGTQFPVDLELDSHR